MTNKTYILLKDLPDAKAGDEYESVIAESNKKRYYRNKTKGGFFTYSQEQVENNPEWFKLKEEPIYTESDLKKAAQDAFVAAREEVPQLGRLGGGGLSQIREYRHKYKTFHDYLNSKQK